MPDASAAASAEKQANSVEAAGGIRRFLQLAGPYFNSDQKWTARLLAFGVIALTLFQIGIQIRLNLWNRDFFNALEARNWNAFLGVMTTFAVLASVSMGVAVYQIYLKQLLQLRWRRWLTQKLVATWLQDGRHYQLNFVGGLGIDNPDQRLTENVQVSTEMSVDFALGIINAALTLIAFSGILWALSGSLPVDFGPVSFEIPGYMVWAALVYAAAGSVATYLIGRPIVSAYANQNMVEADYRFALVRLRENSEGVALIGGENDEGKGLRVFFAKVYAATTRLMRAQRRLMWLTSSYALISMVYPALVASPRYFSGEITLGGLMQITLAFQQVQVGLNWFLDNFPKIAEWRSQVGRLLQFEQALETTVEATTESGDATSIHLEESKDGDEKLVLQDLQIAHADGTVVIKETSADIKKGEHLLIMGDSGSGKSTLFRAIAGLWPWGAGTIVHPPRDQMMFMPQRPYLPLGTLRAAVCYPSTVKTFTKEQVTEALEKCQLGHLVDRMDETDQWTRILSGGEQQRIAFGRLLLHKPGWVFMDEATSALDEKTQEQMMSLFKTELKGSSAISIAHRGNLDSFHDRTLTLVKTEGGARLVTKRKERPARRRYWR